MQTLTMDIISCIADTTDMDHNKITITINDKSTNWDFIQVEIYEVIDATYPELVDDEKYDGYQIKNIVNQDGVVIL